MLPQLEQGEDVETREVESLRKETQPPRRFTEASLLGAMETAGKEIDDDELREAMKESGIGTPATRASIIERLISVGYIEREGRALARHREGHPGDRAARRARAHLARADRRLGAPPTLIEHGEDSRPAFMKDIAKFIDETVKELDKLKDVKIERANLGPCPVCGRDIIENRKGYSCWSREDPGCGFVIWKKKAGKTLPVSVVEGADRVAAESIGARRRSRRRRTEKQVTGFRGRSGRTFRAKLQARADTRRASGASSSTRSGRRSRRRASPRRSARSGRPVARRSRRGRRRRGGRGGRGRRVRDCSAGGLTALTGSGRGAAG